jgi:anaerobic selenocysteine-containing dehydrogenase
LHAALWIPYISAEDIKHSLAEVQQYPIAQINPETAKNLGIEDGDWMWIESPRGRIKQKARLYPGVDPRVVMGTANCYYPE